MHNDELIVNLQKHYYYRAITAKHKADTVFPLHAKERRLRLDLLDEARICGQIWKILMLGDLNKISTSIELQIKSGTSQKLTDELKKLQKKLSKDLIPPEYKVGITELADPSINLSWVERLCPYANIVITKNLRPIIPQILANKHRIILHVTCTGFGGTPFEPNVPMAPEQIMATKELIAKGFPVNQIVLRLDPIIFVGNIKDVMLHDTVMQYFADMGITRCRYSFLDQYEHVKQNFANIGIPTSKGFHYPHQQIELHSIHLQEKWGSTFHLEACCETTIHQQACISQMDIDILKQNANITGANVQELNKLKLVGSKGSRKNCQCPLNKMELIRTKPGYCALNCTYCYWKKMR